jgi:hypothetical protein
MHFIIRFESTKFDLSREKENPINPIHGTSLLLWLRDKLAGQLQIPEPEAEDWGWYCYIIWSGRRYMLGSSAGQSADGNHEWILQVAKHRSFIETVLGKEKMQINDPCLQYFHGVIRNEPAFSNVSVE